MITSSDCGWGSKAAPGKDWLVDNYFDTGLRVTEWMGGQVEKYHRTVEDYFNTLQRTDFVVEHLRSRRHGGSIFKTSKPICAARTVPLFLFIVGRKKPVIHDGTAANGLSLQPESVGETGVRYASKAIAQVFRRPDSAGSDRRQNRGERLSSDICCPAANASAKTAGSSAARTVASAASARARIGPPIA